MLFQKLHELFEFVIRGFHMIILYQFIVVSLCELVHVSIDCGGVSWERLKSTVGYLLYAEFRINKIFTCWSD